MNGSNKTRNTMVALFAAAAVLGAVSLALLIASMSIGNKIWARGESSLQAYALADGLRQTSDDLTRMARLYAATGDARYREWFQQILDIRNGAAPRPTAYRAIYWDFVVAGETPPGDDGPPKSLDALLSESGLPPEIVALLMQSEANSNALAELETDAMTAAGGGDLEQARRILNGADYHQRKADIMRPINDALVGTYIGAATDIGRYSGKWLAVTYALLATLAVSILLGIAGAIVAFRARPGGGNG